MGNVKFWSPLLSNSMCSFVASTYVLGLYMIPNKIRKLPRENSEHIFYRLGAASISTVFSSVTSYIISKTWNYPVNLTFFELIGFRIDNMAAVCWRTFALMAAFYAGPLLTASIHLYKLQYYEVSWNGELKQLYRSKNIIDVLYDQLIRYRSFYGDLVIVRNVLFAPITEEIVFRGLMLPSLFSAYCMDTALPSQATVWSILYLCPIFFGLAHVHHFIEKVRNGTALLPALASTVIQTTYTSIFGFIAGILFTRTGSIFGPITSHIICNIIGLPDTGFLFTSKDVAERCSEYSYMYPYRYGLLVVHAVGLAVFSSLLLPCTDDLARRSIFWPSSASNST